MASSVLSKPCKCIEIPLVAFLRNWKCCFSAFWESCRPLGLSCPLKASRQEVIVQPVAEGHYGWGAASLICHARSIDPMDASRYTTDFSLVFANLLRPKFSPLYVVTVRP